ncbi:CheY-like receiver domain-containing protein, partial [Blyttiomyces helicus]
TEKHVLIVNDNRINLKIAEKILKDLGYNTALAENGFEALSKVENGNYDAILMDVRMPIMDGYEATNKIRKSGNNVPIIAVTANAMDGERENCKQAGMNDYLTKPLNKKVVGEMLQKWIVTQI